MNRYGLLRSCAIAAAPRTVGGAAAAVHGPTAEEILAGRSFEQRLNSGYERDCRDSVRALRGDQHHGFAFLKIGECSRRGTAQNLLRIHFAARARSHSLTHAFAAHRAAAVPASTALWASIPAAAARSRSFTLEARRQE